MNYSFGLAHLSALHLSPPKLVEAAAAAGFTSVGVRVYPATRGEMPYPMMDGSPMLRKTLERLNDTELQVRDIEAFTLDGQRNRNDWLPVVETGSALGASVLNVICGDSEPNRLEDTLSALVKDALEHGIRASVEPISYQPVSTVRAAIGLSQQTGCGIMLDVLHFMRGESSLADLALLPHDDVTCIQLCDGPQAPPDIQPPRHMPLGQSVASTSLQLESRSKRMAPGQGEFPLIEILQAQPNASLSIEVPDVNGVEEYGTAKHLQRIHSAAVNLLDTATKLKVK